MEKIWKGLGKRKKLLTSYLQGIISIHHPTVCPGGDDQEASREEGKEAGDVLQEVPHLSEQPAGGDAREGGSPAPTQAAGMLSLSRAAGTWGGQKTGPFLFLTPHCGRLELQ